MSSEPRPYPTYAPDPPSRFRWVPPLCLGIALGGLIGCVATFAVLELGKQSRSSELVVERFNTSQVMNAVPGTGNVTFTGDTTSHLGRYSGGRSDSGSAVHRRMQIQGSLPKGTDAGTFAQLIAAQIDAELSRLGAFKSGGSTMSDSGGNVARETRETSYYTRDGRRGCFDLDLTVRDGRVEGTLILTEGR
jgi:hypothetical protein